MSMLNSFEGLENLFDTIVQLSKNKIHLDVVKQLLSPQIEKHINFKHNSTLLKLAIITCNYELVSILIKRGNSSFKEMDKCNNNILNLICQYDSSIESYIKEYPELFLHIDFNHQNNYGETILHSASINIKTPTFCNYLLNNKDLNPKEHLKVQDLKGNTCLFYLVINNRVNELKQCVQLNKDCIFLLNHERKTILDIALDLNQQEIIDYLNPFFLRINNHNAQKEISSNNFNLFDPVKIKSTNQTGIVLSDHKDFNFVTIVLNNFEKEFIKNTMKSDLELIQQKKELNESGDFIYDASKIQKGQLLLNDNGQKYLVVDVDTNKKNFVIRSLQSEYTAVYHYELVPFKKFFWFA